MHRPLEGISRILHRTRSQLCVTLTECANHTIQQENDAVHATALREGHLIAPQWHPGQSEISGRYEEDCEMLTTNDYASKTFHLKYQMLVKCWFRDLVKYLLFLIIRGLINGTNRALTFGFHTLSKSRRMRFMTIYYYS